ncbi:MAG: hypothetical protein A2315_17405 [Ignavibacteria bacterium RIFOXYB2_FULL_35_12]|nr:MAG: hypothetical protein A2058_02665 [Ignavibacteria bacterium GWA2_36_19]OGU52888.1 MAG: hypothetical protein A2006_03410 [Ignavibacteria bacterium GWC2_35_8]OGU57842.1 MAG: hypothetical protein A2X60_11600 [Ignavibacteria bacterium GWF2_35_20]OGU81882.1 MAG: hypothetical protein A2254_14360 [Ignavibacteria bacterium RIFOXYA2_FULL_35_9]OGU88065.1 MAG: hypothetical protein A3K31_16415 [Ignavibacteria bacterium RIFOXYA12_FULL_35_25]OGU93092.1 MAG: hypothetical protein A2347_07800 [Ignavibac
MKNHQVSLHCDYIINIKAKNEEEAKFLAEFFIGGEKDCSNEKERKQYKFKIEEIEMVMNEVLEIKMDQ